jgi:type IV conjugative transfer system lipoprotein TraV
MKISNFLILLIAIITTSCSSNVKGDWSCPTLKGGKGHCVSISEADDYKLSNDFTSLPQSYFDKSQKIKIKLIAPKLADLKKITPSSLPNLEPTPQISPNSKLRTEEKIGRIWFAPYIDSGSNQHSESIIYVVDEEPKWVSKR